MLNTLGRKGISAVGAAICVAVLVAGWFLLVSPLKSDIAKTKADTATQVQDNDSARLKLSAMQSIAKNLPKEQAELAQLSQAVPDSADLPALLKTIQNTADSTGVSMTSLSPTVPAALTNAPGISAVQISMAVSGGYAELEQFDSALEGLKRTFLVSGFTMAGGGDGSTGTSATSTSSDSATNISATFSGQVLLKTAPVASATTGS
jgi:Tfp pilus assembly protein PilO